MPESVPALRDGFAEKYTKENASNDNAEEFVAKDKLMELSKSQRVAIKATLAGLSAEELIAASTESFQSYAPTVGAVFSMIGSHWLMNAGQWVVLRRELGREIVI